MTSKGSVVSLMICVTTLRMLKSWLNTFTMMLKVGLAGRSQMSWKMHERACTHRFNRDAAAVRSSRSSYDAVCGAARAMVGSLEG